jgi:hypothetical protein
VSGAVVRYTLLFVCWISALVTLVVFLESWFALTRRSQLSPRRSSNAEGVVSLIVPIQSTDEAARRGLQSVLDQSYPFIELLLLYEEGNVAYSEFVSEYRTVHSHVSIREVPVPFSLDSESGRIRGLEHAQPSIRGSWILIVDADIVMDTYAVESAMEFASTEDISAVAMIPGVECRSLVQKLLAPSLEWFVRMLRAVDRGREKSGRLNMTAPFLLLHGHTHSVLNKMNRMPGILNESGWTLWSYKVEGLRTFHGDGAGWIAREATVQSLLATLDTRSLIGGRVMGFALGSAVVSIVSVIGIIFGFLYSDPGFSGLGILYFSAFSYSLMATSYFFYARRLGAAVWFAPFWFLSHSMALILTLVELGRSRPTLPAVTVTTDHGAEVPTSEK